MQYTARWGPKGFLVSAGKVVPFMNFQSTVSVKADAQNDTSGTAQTNKKGRELQPITFSTTYLRAAGVDPRAQVEEWESLVGEANQLIIGGKRFGPAKMMLKSVSSTVVHATNDGTFLQADVALTFEEYTENSAATVTPASGISTAAASGAGGQAAAVYAAVMAEQKTALSTGASKSDRASKKIDRMVMAQ